MGHMTRDPQLKYLPSQTPVVEFGLATNRKWKDANGQDREDVCFVECAAFGKQAEVINQYCQKGRPLHIDGRLKYDQWEDKQGGGKRSKLSVVVENFQLLWAGGQTGGAAPASAQPAPSTPSAKAAAVDRQAAQAQAGGEPFPQEPQFKEDDIPF
jgi:single-strand DNA-binding protein